MRWFLQHTAVADAQRHRTRDGTRQARHPWPRRASRCGTEPAGPVRGRRRQRTPRRPAVARHHRLRSERPEGQAAGGMEGEARRPVRHQRRHHRRAPAIRRCRRAGTGPLDVRGPGGVPRLLLALVQGAVAPGQGCAVRPAEPLDLGDPQGLHEERRRHRAPPERGPARHAGHLLQFIRSGRETGRRSRLGG